METKDQKRQFEMGRGVVRDAAVEAQKLLDAQDAGLGMSREDALWDRFLNHVDPRIQFEAFRLLKSYASGKPTEKSEVHVEGQNYVAEVPMKLSDEAWAKRFAPPVPAKKDGQA